MSLNGSGVRDITRVLGVSIGLVINEIKKACNLRKVNWAKLLRSDEIMGPVIIMPIAAELDEQWSFVGNKNTPR